MHEFRTDDALELGDQPLLDALGEKARSSSLSFNSAAKMYFNSASANAALSERPAKAISGSIIQNSTKWRLVFEFSARRGRPKGVDLGQCQAVRLDIELPRDRQKRLAAQEILREIDLAVCRARQIGKIQGRHPEHCRRPSASEAVMIGVLTQKKPFSPKNRWIALARLRRRRVAAPITLVSGRRCATSRKTPRCAALVGSGSSTQPITRSSFAYISRGCPVRWQAGQISHQVTTFELAKLKEIGKSKASRMLLG